MLARPRVAEGGRAWSAVGELIRSWELPTSGSDGNATSEPGLFFPKDPEQVAYMEALYQGPLVVRDGCALIGRPGDYSLPIWRKGFTAERDESGRLLVRVGEGAVEAIEDESFEMGGGLRRGVQAARQGRTTRGSAP